MIDGIRTLLLQTILWQTNVAANDKLSGTDLASCGGSSTSSANSGQSVQGNILYSRRMHEDFDSHLSHSKVKLSRRPLDASVHSKIRKLWPSAHIRDKVWNFDSILIACYIDSNFLLLEDSTDLKIPIDVSGRVGPNVG